MGNNKRGKVKLITKKLISKKQELDWKIVFHGARSEIYYKNNKIEFVKSIAVHRRMSEITELELTIIIPNTEIVYK